MQYSCSQQSTYRQNNQQLITQQRSSTNGLITARQAIEVYKQNPDWARSECQNLRRVNRSGKSVNGDFWLTKSVSNYKMTSIQLEMMNGWLTGNFCPDVF